MDSITTRFKKEVFIPYVELLKAQYRFHPNFNHVRKTWEERLTEEELINGPYLEKSQIYATGESLDSLPLHEKTRKTIRKRLGSRDLWSHQTNALRLLLNGENAVIATGTSSGKTLCYQIPILDDLVRDPSPGLRAVIIYPLNALVNDQLLEWEQMLEDHPRITFARFTGQTPNSQIEYKDRLVKTIREQLVDQTLTQYELQQKIEKRLEEKLYSDIPNRLNHRDDIRSNPPHVLITNFSMLEYLLERPVDAPIFENAHLKFLVLDEAHAYRGVQSTEIAFLIRRFKEHLGLEKVTCIATSATLGKQDDSKSKLKVRKFATELFGEDFPDANPIYGKIAEPVLEKPSFRSTPSQYIEAAKILQNNIQADVSKDLGSDITSKPLASLLYHDENLYRLRKDILTKPTLLTEASKQLWPDDSKAEDGLQALLEIVVFAKKDQSHEDLLPTRLHYFVRAQGGLYICLHKQCPGRQDGKPAFFVSRKNQPDIPEGHCPDCNSSGFRSLLVELVTCRKCGYLYGALEDLGPRRAQYNENDSGNLKPYFDSFSPELGWAADSFWSYFSIEDDLPYPLEIMADEEEQDLINKPVEINWCVVCGKKKVEGAGDNCACDKPHIRKLIIFHRQ